MSFTKFASFEVSEILDVKGSPSRATPSLSKVADYHDYRTEDGYLYARIRAISSRVNKNNDGWPSVELAGGQDIWDKFAAQRESAAGGFTVEADTKYKHGYSTFIGKPIFVDHHNSDPKKARGVIVDAKLHVEDHRTASDLDPYYASAPDEHMPPTWVELLLEVDAKSFPKLAQAIIEGSKDPNKGIDGFSMGCDVEKTICSICKNAATSPDEYCSHVKLKGAEFDVYSDTGHKTSKKAYEDCYGIGFFEISAVFDPADETALTREIRASVAKEGEHAEQYDLDRPEYDELMDASVYPESGGSPCTQCGGTGMRRDAWGVDAACDECQGAGRILQGDGVFTPQTFNPAGTGVAIVDPSTALPGATPRQGSVKTAAPIPQSELTKAPDEVNTLRKEIVCEVCGSTIDDVKCDVCGWMPPPEGLDTPDLSQAREHEQPSEELDLPEEGTSEPTLPQEGTSYLRARNSTRTKAVTSDMAWEPELTPRISAILAERETQSDEPQNEEVVKDEDKPTTASTETHMSDDTRVAAEPADSSGKPDKQVDTTGVGGVVDSTNEQASKADKQVDVEGKGGTGVEDVSADETQSVAQTADDNAGFDKTKNTDDSGKTDTFDLPSNHLDAGRPHDNSAFPKGGAKKGTDPVDAVGKPDQRVDLEEEVQVSWHQNADGTDQWTGTDGNGVTKQQNPVTPKVGPGNDVRSSATIFAALKLADTEVALGLIDETDKYDRIAELEQKGPETIRELSAYADRVKTAGLRRQPQAREARRMPSLSPRAAATPEPVEEPNQEREDAILFA